MERREGILFEQLRQLPQNQDVIRQFALDQAENILASADVVTFVPESTGEMRVGDAMRILRKQNKFSFRVLAKKSGISPIQLSRIERLESDPTEQSIRAIARAFNVSVGFLFGENQDSTSS
jgi:ribosome-binding protein aMBF1 (putative translation factor)